MPHSAPYVATPQRLSGKPAQWFQIDGFNPDEGRLSALNLISPPTVLML
jgi:hypothetical protein